MNLGFHESECSAPLPGLYMPVTARHAATAKLFAAVVATIVFLACAAPMRASADQVRIAQWLDLREGRIELAVRFDRGEEAWAHYVAERCAQYLPAVERYLDMPLHRAAKIYFGERAQPWTIEIVGAREVMQGGVRVGAYNNLGGYYPGERAVFVEYGLAPRGNPATVLHELSHLWIYVTAATRPPAGAPWFVEGAASALPLALAEAGRLPLGEAEVAALRAHWGIGWTPAREIDLPVIEDLRLRGGSFVGVYYSKTFKLQLILRRELGAPGYAGLLRRAAGRMPLESDRAVFALLDEMKRGDWRSLLSGWLTAGTYRHISPDAFMRARGAAPMDFE